MTVSVSPEAPSGETVVVTVPRCRLCGTSLTRRRDAQYCTPACRLVAHRTRQRPWADRTAEAYGLSKRDLWRTPPWLFRALDDEFHFTLDAASSGEADALCEEWLTPTKDALSCVWPVYLHLLTGRGAAWCNPPYSAAGGGLLAWVEACLRARKRQTVVLIAPGGRPAAWTRLVQREADEVRELARRVSFVPPPGLTSSTPANSTYAIVFREGGHGPARRTLWDPPGATS